MSGQPYPNGAAALSAEFRALNEARQKIARLQGVIETQKQAIVEERVKENAASENIKRLMADMDVSSPGNFGYEGRLMWLLREMNTQAEEYGRVKALTTLNIVSTK